MNDPSLTNFNVPSSIKTRFDAVCRASGRTRTSILVELMERFIVQQGQVIAARNADCQRADEAIQNHRRIMGFKEFWASQSKTPDNYGQIRFKPDSSPPSFAVSDADGDRW